MKRHVNTVAVALPAGAQGQRQEVPAVVPMLGSPGW
jgi:hypothetical protein